MATFDSQTFPMTLSKDFVSSLLLRVQTVVVERLFITVDFNFAVKPLNLQKDFEKTFGNQKSYFTLMRCLSRTTELHILDFVERVKKADSNNLDVFCDFNQYRFYSSHIFYQ